MKIGIKSDIHLEFGDYDQPMGEGKVLILSGDIHVAAYLHSEHPSVRAQGMRERSQRFIERAKESYDFVLSVMGNHEHYNGVYDYSHRILERYVGDSRHMILERESVLIDDVVFYGATFWTDFNGNDAHTKAEASFAMNDYHSITKYDDQDLMEQRKLRPDDVLIDHYAAVQTLKETVHEAQQAGHRVVVMSHHAPSKRSTSHHYKHPRHETMNGMYSTNLEHLMGEHIPLWTHGHTHTNFDYVVNGTRVVCNPRGYVGHALNPGFQPELVVEI